MAVMVSERKDVSEHVTEEAADMAWGAVLHVRHVCSSEVH